MKELIIEDNKLQFGQKLLSSWITPNNQTSTNPNYAWTFF